MAHEIELQRPNVIYLRGREYGRRVPDPAMAAARARHWPARHAFIVAQIDCYIRSLRIKQS